MGVVDPGMVIVSENSCSGSVKMEEVVRPPRNSTPYELSISTGQPPLQAVLAGERVKKRSEKNKKKRDGVRGLHHFQFSQHGLEEDTIIEKVVHHFF